MFNKSFEYYKQGFCVKMNNFYWFGMSNHTAMAYQTYAFQKFGLDKFSIFANVRAIYK